MRRSIISSLMVIFVAFAVFAAFPAIKVKADTGDITITTQPSDYTGQAGETARFTVVAEGNDLTYQWQLKKGSSWSNLSSGGATTSTLSIKIDAAKDGKTYHCVITDTDGNSVTSEPASIHIPEPEKELAIVTQPTDYVGAIGDTAKFTIVAEGNGLTYQWQLKKGSSWYDQNSGGAKTATFSVKLEESRVGKTYRCIVTDNKGDTKTSAEVQLKLSEPEIPLEITSQPADYKGDVGETAKFTVGAVGNGLTYQWQLKKGSSWTNLSSGGATTATLSIKIDSARYGKQYQCVVSDERGNSVTSSVVTIKEKVPTALITLNAGAGHFDNGTNTKVVEVDQGRIVFDDFENPDIIGYAFTGWLYNGQPINVYNVTGNMELTADYAKIWLVTFDANGGTFEDGEGTMDCVTNPGYYTIDENLIPVKEGYCFMGWKIGNQAAGKRIRVNSDVTLTAQWVEGVKVTYIANGGSWVYGDDSEQSVSFMVPKGKYFVEWEEPRREGYKFEGWKILGGDWVGMITLTEDITFEAQWKRDIKVTFDPNGGGWYEKRHNDQTGEDEDYLDTTPREEWFEEGPQWFGYWGPDRGEDYEFLGWSTDKNAVAGQHEYEHDFQEDVTFYAIWAKKAKYVYDAGEGFFGPRPEENHDGEPEGEPEEPQNNENQDPNDQPYKIKTEYVRNGEYYTIRNENPWRDGYEFETWLDSEGNDVGNVEIIADNTEVNYLTAKWRKRVSITYNAGDGIFYDGANGSYFQIRQDERWEGENYELDGFRPEREDYEFAGWLDQDGNLYTEKDGRFPEITLEDKDYYFTATWLKRLTITYNAGKGSFDGWDERENENTHIRDALEGQEYEIDGWRPERDGYDFDGWLDEDNNLYTDDDGHGFPVITLGDQDVTFEAQWTERVTITYNAGEGEFDGWDEWNNETSKIHYRSGRVGEPFEIDGWNPQNGDKIFVGWSTSPYGYSPVPANAVFMESMTLYAIWQDRAKLIQHTTMGFWGRDQEDNPILTLERDQEDDGGVWIDGWWPEDVPFNYELIGYATEENGDVVYENGQRIDFLYGDLDIYAVWRKKPTITYVATDGTTFSDGSTERVDCDDVGRHYYIRNEVPQRDGYRFAGWEDENGVDYTDECILLTDGFELTVYTKWEFEGGDGPMYKVTYMPNGGSFGMPEDEDFVSWDQPADENYDVGCWWPHREGYDFVGWSTDPNQDPATAVTTYPMVLNQDTTFYAVWQRRTVVTLDCGEDGWFSNYVGNDENTGAPIFEQTQTSYEYVITGTEYSTNWIYDVPFSDNNVFVGWTLDGENIVTEIDTDTDVTLYAKWAKGYNVVVDACGGHFEDGSTAFNYQAFEGDTIITRWFGRPVREGYTFAGWAIDGEIVRTYEVDGAFNVQAIWIADNEA